MRFIHFFNAQTLILCASIKMCRNKHTPKCQRGFCVILEKEHIKTLAMSRRRYARWDKIKKNLYRYRRLPWFWKRLLIWNELQEIMSKNVALRYKMGRYD